jgi:hypothetical protein
MSNLPQDKPSFTKRFDTDRILGLVLTIGGVAAIYYFVIRQALAAIRHAPGVFLSLNGVMVSPVALAIGVIYTVFGSRATDALGDNKARPTRTTWILIVLFCAGDCCLYSWLKSFIEGYGYASSY